MATIQSKVVQLLQDSPVVKRLAKEVYGDVEKAAESLMGRFAGKEDIKAADLAAELVEQKKLQSISPEEARAFEDFVRKEGLPTERGGLPAVREKPAKRKLITPELIEAGPSSLEKPKLLKAGREDIIELPGEVDTGIEPRAKILSERGGLPKREEQKLLPEGRPDAIPMPGKVDDGIEPPAKILSKRENGVPLKQEPETPAALIDRIQKGKKRLATGAKAGAAGTAAVAGASMLGSDRDEDIFAGVEDLDTDYIPSPKDREKVEEPVSPKEEVKPKTLSEAVSTAKTSKTPSLKEKIAPKKEVAPAPKEEGVVSDEKPSAPLSLAERIKGIESKRTEAKALREEQRKRADWGELATTIGRALTQIGAAQQGLRTGVDMSNVLGPALTDWDKKRDRIDNDYKQEIAELSAEQREITRLAEREEDKAARKEYQDKQMELEKEKLKAQKERERIKQAGKIASDNLKALATKNTAALKAQTKKTNDALKDSESQFKKLREIEGMIVGDVDEAKIRQKAVELFGKDAIVEERKYLWDKKKGRKEIQELLKGELDSTQSAIDSYKKQLELLQSGGAPTPSPTPAQPVAPAAPTEKRQDVQEYADKFVGGDYNRAYEILKRKGQL